MLRFLFLLTIFALTACAPGARVGAPDLYTYSATFDQCGRVVSRTDARGVVTNYTWDALNRLTSIAYPSDSSFGGMVVS
jgi:YD repeat-containing protein